LLGLFAPLDQMDTSSQAGIPKSNVSAKLDYLE
jgi:hypothetical protein